MSPADEAAEMAMDSTLLRILPSKLEQRLCDNLEAEAGAACKILAKAADDEAAFMFEFMRGVAQADAARPRARGCRPGCSIA